MKLPVETRIAVMALACSGLALGAGPVLARNLPPAPAMPDGIKPGLSGPAADYPVVVGEPYRVGDTLFTPVNAMNYDAVGYASVAGQGAGISAAHHTLPLPSYVEVTALASGRTILVRVDRRGPMDGTHAIELSPAAAQQLGVGSDAPVRVRRVNPLESERALLRLGQNAPERIDTPKPLLTVLQRRLASDPAASHAGASLARSALIGVATEEDAPAKAPARLATKPVVPKPVIAKPTPRTPPAAGANFADATPLPPAKEAKPKPAPKPPVQPAPSVVPSGTLVVQIGAFGEKSHAAALADKAHGHVSPAGKLWRVRTGPYATRAQADAALAKARAAGYTDARIQRAD